MTDATIDSLAIEWCTSPESASELAAFFGLEQSFIFFFAKILSNFLA